MQNNLTQGVAYSQPSPQPQQQPAYSSEPAMQPQPQQSNQLVAVEAHLDNESIKILQEASSAHTQSIINLGIKLFSKTNIYQEFMLNEEFKKVEIVQEDIISNVSTNITDTLGTSNTPQATIVPQTAAAATAPTAEAAPKSTGFAKW